MGDRFRFPHATPFPLYRPFGLAYDGEPPATPPAGDPPKNEPRTFDQAEVNRIAAREKAEGRAAAERELAEQLGCSVEDAKGILTAHRDKSEAEKTEAQRAIDAATKEKDEAAKAKRAASRERQDARIERALIRAGVDPDRVERLTRLVDVDVDDGAEKVTDAVAALRADMPELFAPKAPATDPKGKKPPASDPKGTPPRTPPSEDEFSKGTERAAAFNPRSGPAHPFGKPKQPAAQ